MRCREKGGGGGEGGHRERKGCVEGLRKEGNGRVGRPDLFMLSISGCLAVNLSILDFRTGAADHVSR